MMKRWLTLIACLLFPTLGWAQQPAFPTAEGVGRYATGGRGDGATGYVCHVNSLGTTNTGNVIGSGPHHQGTLHYCLARTGPRTIVPDIGGRINWTTEFPPMTSNFTFAGQTAPGDGIMLSSLQFAMNGINNVILRYLRVRPGSGGDLVNPTSFGGIVTEPGGGASSFDIIVDHFSVGWTSDNSIGGAGNSYNITYQWGIISEGMPAGGGSQSMLWNPSGFPGNRVSVLNNLFANWGYRVPSMSAGDTQLVNNVIYNASGNASQLYPAYSALDVEFVENYYKPGPLNSNGTRFHNLGCGYDTFINCTHAGNSTIYLSGNYHPQYRPNDTFAEGSIVLQQGGTPRAAIVGAPTGTFSDSVVSVVDSQQAYINVLANAGARLPTFDSIDLRAISDVQNGTGTTYGNESLTPGGGYPSYSGSRLAGYDTDSDGIPDIWETDCASELSLSPSDSNDGNDILSGVHANVNGYSKLEIYLNEVAGDYVAGTCGFQLAQSSDATPPDTAPTLSQPTSSTYDTVDLSWTAVTDPESNISTYHLSWCSGSACTPSQIISVGNVLTYQHTGRTGSTLYRYEVAAVSGGGEGPKSSTQEVTTPASPAADITSNLLGHYTFDNTLTDAATGDGAQNATANATPVYPAGALNQALTLDGTSQYLNMGDVFNVGADEPFTVALWIKTTPTPTSDRQLVANRGTLGYQIRYTTGAGFFVRFDEASGLADRIVQGTLFDGSWHLVVFGRSLTEQFVSVDGASPITFADATPTSLSDVVPFVVGTSSESGQQGTELWAGDIDDLRFYARALNAIDIQALFDLVAGGDTQAPTDPANLVATPIFEDPSLAISLAWDASTEDSGSPSYSIERCQVVTPPDCVNFAEISTSPSANYFDNFLAESTTYCYRVRAFDAVPNYSGYSNVACALTLSVVGFIVDGIIDSISGLTSMVFLPDGVIDSVSGLGLLPILGDGVIDSVSGLTGIGFIPDGTIDSVSVD